MKKIYSIVVVLLVVFTAGFISSCTCKRTQEGIMGPVICPSEKFAVTSDFMVFNQSDNNPNQVNLLTSYGVITADFNEVVDWSIAIKGLTSGAVTNYKGKGKDINVNWYGEPSTSVFYKKGEQVSFSLFVACKKEPIASYQVQISTVAGLAGFGGKITNFEDSPVFSGLYHKDPANPCSSTILTPGDPGYMESPQGENYLNFKCTLAPGAKEWYFGGTGFPIDGFAMVSKDPSMVYLNVLAKGGPNSQAQLIMKENVFGNLQTRKFLVTVSDEWTLYSVKLSDIGIIDVSEVKNLDLNLGAATSQANSASVDLDMIILTNGKPLGQ